MIAKETQLHIQKIIESILEKMGIAGSVDIAEYFDGIKFNIKSHEGGVLIGENGVTLRAVNHVVHRIADKGISDEKEKPLQFLVDVNDYQKQRADHLYDLARMSAQRVRYFKKEVEMNPMPPFERRIIHTALMEYPDITTQSIGEGFERRVVIKPLD